MFESIKKMHDTMREKVYPENIPDDIKACPQWLVWQYVKKDDRSKPTKIPCRAKDGRQASNANPNDWCSFEDALAAFRNNARYTGIGFVFTENDPFAFIDIDDTSGIENPDLKADQDALVTWIKQNAPASYTEISPSGAGYHIILKCNPDTIPQGKRKGVGEVYVTGRYATFTGNTVNGRTEIIEGTKFVREIYTRLGGVFESEPPAQALPKQALPKQALPKQALPKQALPKQALPKQALPKQALPELKLPATPVEPVLQPVSQQDLAESDARIVALACGFENGEKFKDLYNGKWQDPKYRYPSQSEADYALINLIQFCTYDGNQIARIFRASSLGQRTKAGRDDYVGPMIEKAMRDNPPPPPVDFDLLKKNFEARKAKEREALISQMPPVPEPVQANPQMPPVPEPVQAPAVQQPVDPRMPPDPVIPEPDPVIPEPTEPVEYGDLEYPFGLTGDIARFLYKSANRPFREVAITGALGLMAAITGRAYSINGSGLNLYLTLLAKTGRGKEAMKSGTGRLMKAVSCEFKR